MTEVQFAGRTARFYLDRTAVGGSIELVLQCSGSVLVEARIYFPETDRRGFFTAYETKVLRNGYVDDRMYAGNAKFSLSSEELDTIREACVELRNRNSYDSSLEAGPTIREMFE